MFKTHNTEKQAYLAEVRKNMEKEINLLNWNPVAVYVKYPDIVDTTEHGISNERVLDELQIRADKRIQKNERKSFGVNRTIAMRQA